MTQIITDFIDSIENNLFIEAHEILENSWKSLKNEGLTEEARVQKGLINGATAVGLIFQKNRMEAGMRLWMLYKDKYQEIISSAAGNNSHLYLRAAEILDVKYKQVYDSKKN